MLKLCDIGRWIFGSDDGDEYCWVPPSYANLIAPGIKQFVSTWLRQQMREVAETPSVLIPTILWCDYHDWDRTLEFYDDPDTKAAVFKISSAEVTNTVELPLDLFLNDEYGEMKRRVLAGIPR